MILSVAQARQYAAQAGFSGIAQDIIVAIAQAESSLNTSAMNCNNPGGSCDRGVLQINSYWHPEVSDQCAFDPACAFQQAFRISKNGTDFSQWVTYQNGSYQKYISSGSSGNKPWYMYPVINNYGSPDPYGGFPKPDINVAAPSGTPITALMSGTVSGINSPNGGVPAWGNVITIRLDNPINPVATHIAYLHLASLAPGISIGQHVDTGTIIGYSGGTNPGPGLQQASPGVALYNGDYYGYGPSWNQYLGSSQLNPTQFWSEVMNGTINSGTNSTNSTPGYNTGFNVFDLSGLISAINNLPNTIIAEIVSNEYFQRGAILFIGILIILIAILIIFFSNPGNRQLVMEAGAASV